MLRSNRFGALKFARVLLLSLLVISLTSAPEIQAQTNAPDIVWPDVELVQIPNLSLNSPVHLTHAGDGSGRLFIVEQGGQIKILENGSLRSTPFLDIRSNVLAPGDPGAGNEEGLLSVAFPPGYAAKDYFYVYYTKNDSNNVVSRFHLLDANRADPDSEEPILQLSHPVNHNHNGGQIAFGPDGYLYVGTGDGGGGGDPNNNAQNPGVLLGKLLRIDTEFGPPANTAAPYVYYFPIIQTSGTATPPTYRIPPDNPFVGQAGYRPEIWALGLRNPWRFSHDRQTGALYIGDVGQGNWEEIDYQPPIAQGGGGENYGWRIMEALHCYPPGANCNTAGLTLPIQEYANTNNPCASVTGGYVYRGTDYPGLQGIYVYTDYCMGQIWGLAREGGVWENHRFDPTETGITSFGEDQDGELYAVDRNEGIYRITVP